MKNILKTITGIIILYLIMPVILGVIIVKAFKDNNGTLLIIIFVSLIVLSIALSIFKFIKYKRDNRKNKI